MVPGLCYCAKLKGGKLQGSVKGSADDIFKQLSKGGQQLPSGAIKTADNTIINMHKSKSTGVSTIDINKSGTIYKIRVE